VLKELGQLQAIDVDLHRAAGGSWSVGTPTRER
jgi:hypothetical protein